MKRRPPPPPSVTDQRICFAGLAGFLAAFLICRWLWVDSVTAVVVMMAGAALPIVALEEIFLRRRGPAPRPAEGPLARATLGRVAVKLIGLAVTLLVLLFLFWLFPAFRNNIGAHVIEPLISRYWLVGLIVTPIYFAITDARMRDPYDAYWQIGAALIGRIRRRDMDADAMREHALGWAVKAFFLPLMIGYFHNDVIWAMDIYPSTDLWRGFQPAYETVFRFSYTIDVAFACMGYLATLKLFDSHIRTTEPTLLGWGVALMCYEPFWPMVYDHFLPYDQSPPWGAWLWNQPALYTLWGVMILGLTVVYVWATVIFGIRFSNLTHRGILTNGPYRFTRHPAYVAKNLSWWLISMPFLVDSSYEDSLRHCIMLAGVNAIYTARALTEERHLARDPDYVAYAQWIAAHGLFAPLGRLWMRIIGPFPGLGWRAGAAAAPAAKDAPPASDAAGAAGAATYASSTSPSHPQEAT